LAEYIALEDAADEKHEFHDGQIVAMAGGSGDHAVLQGQAYMVLALALRGGPCQPHGPDLRIAIPKRRRYFYADASVVCGPREYDPENAAGSGVVNVRVVVEVLSPSTAAFDRTEKFEHYMAMPAFDTYILVYQDQPRVEVRTRQGNDWLLSYSTGLDAVAHIRTLGIQISLAELYRGVTFPPAEPTAEPAQA
jgi:Uma2 family endonuclease